MTSTDQSVPSEVLVADCRHSIKMAFAEFGVDIEKSILLSKTQEEITDFRNPWALDRRAYGAVPHYDKRDEIMKRFPEEVAYFAKYYKPGEKGRPAWMDASYAKGIVLFEMKFDKRLSEFCEEILSHYPNLHKQGKEISLFGLSGSGKSTVTEVMRETLGEDVIVIDSDTVRFNLLAKIVRDIELNGGANIDEVRRHLIHNNISGPLYLAVSHIAKELKTRGYTVIESSTQPVHGADTTIYVEHPDGIDPAAIPAEDENQIQTVAKTLYDRTSARVGGPDNYDWDHAETITDFRTMRDVSVRVPEQVHKIFVKNVGQTLRNLPEESLARMHNIHVDNEGQRRQMIRQELSRILE